MEQREQLNLCYCLQTDEISCSANPESVETYARGHTTRRRAAQCRKSRGVGVGRHDPDFLDEPADIRCASRWMMMKEVITVIKTLPENVQHRVNALKHLQEGKYQELCQPWGTAGKRSSLGSRS
ncbi:nucleosome assembly protein [Culex quinquefasciatus]|uniref:Nucleosome assembly protein n=1 Tax=Culex quinquefasciatus TaxID=7176 RepID=B0WJX4_CULQU|nr:nucleosome assembly protein [Culex quinquefasciatus]|eukprot:XP_001849008.1 nucleosome assembly protein [Culex quinquefasciatus]